MKTVVLAERVVKVHESLPVNQFQPLGDFIFGLVGYLVAEEDVLEVEIVDTSSVAAEDLSQRNVQVLA
jgi:hypothetical protein